MSELRTDRLVLRPWRQEDREPFAEINADPALMRHLTGVPMTRQESDALVDRIEKHWRDWGFGLFAVEERGAGDRFLGFLGPSHHRALPEHVEIGWRLHSAYWGRGFATEGALAVRDWAFRHLGLDRLVSITTRQNVASWRIMEKIGMRYWREMPFERWQLQVYLLPRGRWEQITAAKLAP